MIKVTIIQTKLGYKMMKVTGHANSAPYGEDLICAAVSAVVTGGINALDLKAVKVKNIEGLSDLQILDHHHQANQNVYRVIHTQLQTIASAYPKFVTIAIKEE
jgi:uncharacterized protein